MPENQEYVYAPILPLAHEVAERIAAGEVIERPVSVIKELLENALDAGSHEIRVEVRGGGLRLMRVTDDGVGIPADQLEVACARHSTSKIRRVEDLDHLHTLGFRGEALASIAAVSELTLLSLATAAEGRANEAQQAGSSRLTSPGELDQASSPLVGQGGQNEQTGSSSFVYPGASEQAAAALTVRGGEVKQRGRRARLRGTTVTVRDLFYNVPARLKFMRQARTEGAHILQLLRRYAAGYPGVRFTLQLEDQIALQTSGTGSLSKTLAELYHLPLAEMLHSLQASVQEQGMRFAFEGCVGNRALAQNTRQHITLFVNGRWVQARALQEALEGGYRSLLPKGKHPLLVLHIHVPAEEMDANVHPAKTEVRLLHEREIASALSNALRGVLERSPALPEIAQLPGPTLVFQRRLPGARRRGLHVAESAGEYRAQEEAESRGEAGAAEILRVLRPLAQLQQAVILAEAPDGSLYLIDQHRAHERVIYEHLRQKYVGLEQRVGEDEEMWEETANAHLLLEPVVVELKRHEAEIFEQRLPMLRGLGLECERFGGRSFLVRSVPGGVGQEQLAAHLPELASIASEDSSDWQDRLLIGLACRSALRRGRELGVAEQRALLAALAEVNAPAVCPHGSLILLHYSRAFLIDTFEW